MIWGVCVRRACLALALVLSVTSSVAAQSNSGAPAAAAQPINICSSGYDQNAASNVQNATASANGTTPAPTSQQAYLKAYTSDLVMRAKLCSNAVARARASIHEPDEIVTMCVNPVNLLAGEPDLNHLGSNEQNSSWTEVYAFDTRLAIRVDQICSKLLAEGAALSNTPQSLLFLAARPTVYVLLASGGARPAYGSQSGSGNSSSSSTSSSSSAGSGKGGGGGAGSGPTASVDNPSALLLYTIAERLQHSACSSLDLVPVGGGDETAGTRVPLSLSFPNVAGKAPHTSGPCFDTPDGDNGKGYRLPAIDVVPEAGWSIEDFRTQCASDPFDASGGPPHGTVAGILIDGAITTADGAFHVVTVGGRSEASFASTIVACEPNDANTGPPTNVALWSDLVTAGSSTERLSFFLPALGGTLLAANLQAKSGYVAPITNSESLAQAIQASTTFEKEYTNLTVGSAIGSFLGNVSTLTFGNPSSALTLRTTFSNWSSQFDHRLGVYCDTMAGQANDYLKTHAKSTASVEVDSVRAEALAIVTFCGFFPHHYREKN